MPKTPPYSKEFKREAVQLLRTSGRPVPQLAKELGYHAWAARVPSARAVADAALDTRIAAIHAGSLKTYGSPRVHAELRLEHDVHVGRKRVERLMRHAGLSGLHKRRRGRTTIRVQGVRTAPDLVRLTRCRRWSGA